MAGASVLIRALVELRGKSVEEVKAFLSGKTHAEKLALREVPQVKAIIQRLEAEKASKRPQIDAESPARRFLSRHWPRRPRPEGSRSEPRVSAKPQVVPGGLDPLQLVSLQGVFSWPGGAWARSASLDRRGLMLG
jgi:hypothetical protein